MIVKPDTQPVANPVSLAEAKLHLRVDHSDEDVLIASLVNAATEWCEQFEGQAYMVRSYKAHLDTFSWEVRLPSPPLIAVDSIQYYDANGDIQTLSTDIYTVDNDSVPGRVYLAFRESWPTTYNVPKSVVISYTAGYATTLTAADTDICTVGNAVFADTDRVRVGSGGGLPSGLSSDTDYYVRDVSGSTLKLAATEGGDAVDITTTGTGTHYIGFANRGLIPARVLAAIKLLVGHWYEHREQVSDVRFMTVPHAAQTLLTERVWQ